MTNKKLCKGVTLAGINCKRLSKYGDYCFQHNPKYTQDKPDECVVCYDTLENQEYSLKCGHWIHTNCVILSGKPECPVCRATVLLNSDEKQKLEEVRVQRREETIQEEQEDLIRERLEDSIYEYIEDELQQLLTQLPELANNYGIISIEFV